MRESTSTKEQMKNAMLKARDIEEQRDQHPEGSREWKRLNKLRVEANFEWVMLVSRSAKFQNRLQGTVKQTLAENAA